MTTLCVADLTDEKMFSFLSDEIVIDVNRPVHLNINNFCNNFSRLLFILDNCGKSIKTCTLKGRCTIEIDQHVASLILSRLPNLQHLKLQGIAQLAPFKCERINFKLNHLQTLEISGTAYYYEPIYRAIKRETLKNIFIYTKYIDMAEIGILLHNQMYTKLHLLP